MTDYTDYAALSDDALGEVIAKRLFGWKECTCTRLLGVSHFSLGKGVFYYEHATAGQLESYASDHNAAMGLVVTEMRKRGYEFELITTPEGKTQAIFANREAVDAASAAFGEEPRAICLAALAALGSRD